MNIDAMTLAAVADEWRLLLPGARIDTIIQPTEYALACQCYISGSEGRSGQNRWLYLSAHPQMARAHLTARKPSKIASEPPPFVMLLRKYLEGARIEAVVQPRWERILEIVAGYRKSQDSDERVRFRLIIEIMGRHSNIILCNEEGMILGCLKRIGAEVNRYRIVATGMPYVPPPPQGHTVAGQLLPRLNPASVSAAQLATCSVEDTAEAVHQITEKKRKRTPEKAVLWQLLTRHLSGCSPLLAREVVYRTTGETETPVELAEGDLWEKLAWHMRELAALYDNHNWHPQLIERAEGDGGSSLLSPVVCAPYVLEQYIQTMGMHVRKSPSINILLDDFFARTEWYDALEGIRAPMRKILQTQLERCKRKAQLLQQELATAKEAARYRLQAELLLAHQQKVQQGQTSATVQNFFEDDGSADLPMVTIELDPRFNAVENARQLFNKYHKLRRALALVPGQSEQNAVELATLEQLLADLMLAETPAEVALVKAELQEAGYMRNKQQEKRVAKKVKGGKQKGKSGQPGGGVPLHIRTKDGFTVLIGKNSRQNEEVTFRQAAANDIWLHARGVPGAHVIIKAAGREVPRSQIEEAACLAAYYSQARGSTNVPVDYTLQRHVRHMKGAGPGMVIYEREHTLYSDPHAAEQ